MSDKISRAELFDKLATITAEDANDMKAKIYAVIQEMPTEPSIDIVRCGECKYWRAYKTWSACELWTGDPYETATTNADDFCSYGERKESE